MFNWLKWLSHVIHFWVYKMNKIFNSFVVEASNSKLQVSKLHEIFLAWSLNLIEKWVKYDKCVLHVVVVYNVHYIRLIRRKLFFLLENDLSFIVKLAISKFGFSYWRSIRLRNIRIESGLWEKALGCLHLRNSDMHDNLINFLYHTNQWLDSRQDPIYPKCLYDLCV